MLFPSTNIAIAFIAYISVMKLLYRFQKQQSSFSSLRAEKWIMKAPRQTIISALRKRTVLTDVFYDAKYRIIKGSK